MKCKRVARDLFKFKPVLIALLLTIMSKVILLNLRPMAKDLSLQVAQRPTGAADQLVARALDWLLGQHHGGGFGILFAEAGKKKKKEKSEVVVISVNNPQSKGYGGYPIFIPSCGGHGGGYGRR